MSTFVYTMSTLFLFWNNENIMLDRAMKMYLFRPGTIKMYCWNNENVILEKVNFISGTFD
jgi:hypothetical protein